MLFVLMLWLLFQSDKPLSRVGVGVTPDTEGSDNCAERNELGLHCEAARHHSSRAPSRWQLDNSGWKK